MDIGDYGTNVVCTYELNSIAYSYFECPSEAPSVSTELYKLVAELQQLGFLAAKDNKKTGIWIFETGDTSEPASPRSGSAQLSGLASNLGIDLALKHNGSYDSNALLESWKSLSKPPTNTISSPLSDSGEPLSQKESFERHFRAAQAAVLNKEATANNALIGMNNDAGTPNPTLKDRARQFQLLAQSRLRLHIHDYFLTAVFLSLGYALCLDHGYIPLSSRTLVVPQSNLATTGPQATAQSNNGHIDSQLQLVTLSSDYTGSKVLVIKATLSTSTSYTGCDLSRFVKQEDVLIPANATFILGPGGCTGNYKGLANNGFQTTVSTYATDADEAQRSGNEGQSSTSHRLRSRCLEWLVGKGINRERLENSAWFMVEIYLSQLINNSRQGSSEERVLISWPSFLCFRQIDNTLSANDAFGSLSTYDPLEFAQTWYAGQQDRDATIIRRKKEREAAEAVAKAQADSEVQDLHSLYSPLALRRSSVAGLVYPTPPDGVQHTVVATPTFDEAVSTPGQQGLPLPTDSSSSLVAKVEADANGPLDMASHADFDFQDTSNGNLFGDAGDDLFGEENDITDADFSFFDEPDIFQGNQDVDMPGQDNTAEVVENELTIGPKDDLHMGDDAEMVDIHMGNTDESPVEESLPPDLPSDTNPARQTEIKTEPNLEGPQTSTNELSPPLKPEYVFGRLSTFDVFSKPLLTKPQEDTSTVILNPAGAFGGVDFKALFASLHQKYGTHGRFIYPPPRVSPNTLRAKFPTTDYFNRRRRRKLAGKSSIVRGVHTGADHHFLVPGQATNFEQPTQRGSRSPSPSSDQDDSSDEMDGSFSHNSASLKRRHQVEDNSESNDEDEIASSFQELQVGQADETNNAALDTVYPFALDSDFGRWSAAMFLAWPNPWANEYTLTDAEYISAAQILGDQAISYTLRYPNDGNRHGGSLEENIKATYTPDLIRQDVVQAAKKFFKGANSQTLSNFLDIQGVPRQLASINRLPPRPVQSSQGSQGSQGSNPTKPNPIFPLPSPHLELRRSDSRLSVLPSALPFWDVLGLAPRGNGKHVTSLCVFPKAVGMAESADLFLENIRSAYETKRLGSHDRLNTEGCVNGLLPIELGGQATRFASDQGLSVIREALFQVANLLAASTADSTNFVVYFVYDPESPDILVPICSAFHSMFEVYKTAMAGKTVSNELVLQLVPLSFVSARTHLVVLPPTDYARLAMEVYDRCFDFQSGVASPSVAIERPLPRTIDFKLTANPSASLLQENSCLQIAYAQSIDDRWITAAWSDNTGSEQMTASYCLGRQDAPLTRQFSDIAHEIWETTLDIIASKKVHWRIIIAKCGVMEAQDVRFWKGLSETERNAQISLTLLSVDTQPALQLLPPGLSIPASTLAAQSTFYTTPVSTPQPSSILSPDQSGSTPTATPTDGGAELKIEPDATLIDLTNQSYGAVLAHRVNNSNSPLEVRPTAISGYLIKRTGASSSDIPAVMEVNIVWTDINPRLAENPLKEILAWYSGLATLARARGIVDPVKDTRPWHIAAAEKAVRLLYLLM
ncbi:hypothetical protein V502_08299 [Pseudogymnoascus sp. VKM F-4520 (FW-2644)]|nr:hypothetical protein V502_08299 [Pseudogymnoascus sp. VKM F-4520 (FW-2644)]